MSETNNTFAKSYAACKDVSDLCPVEATVLGYTPNLGANAFFAVAFGITMLATFAIGFWKRTWTFAAAVGCGALLETAGYIGRALMHSNPWAKDPFQLQICAIVIGPTIICAGIYLVIKHVALHVDPTLSRFRPRFYPLFFLPADVSCLVIQAIGGGLAASGGDGGTKNRDIVDAGNRMIIAGICLQVVVLLLFGLVCAEYLWKVAKKAKTNTRQGGHEGGVMPLWFEKRFRIFLVGVSAAYFAVFTRCIYRIAEMAGGWGNHIMQDEISFMVLDSGLMLICVGLLTIFAPGIWFPQMANSKKHSEKATDTTNPTSPATSSHGKMDA